MSRDTATPKPRANDGGARSKREPGTARARTLDYGSPYPYWLRGKVKRIRR